MTDVSAAPAILISRMLPDEAVRLARSRARVDIHDGDAPLRKPELVARLKGRQGLICLVTDQIDDELLAACPDLRVVANVAVGFNNIDVEAATRRGVVITNTPDVLTETTADFAWALLMATARRVVEGDQYVRQGRFKQWEYMRLLGGDVHGKTLGIIGFGRIGRAMARRALGFGMRVLAVDIEDVAPEPGVEAIWKPDRLGDLLGASDAVVICLPLTKATHHLFTRDLFRKMKRTGYLINVTRGAIVYGDDLLKALDEEMIGGAGLDVTDPEPLPAGHRLWNHPRAIVTPHTAGGSPRRAGRVIETFCENLRRMRSGQPLIALIDKRKGY